MMDETGDYACGNQHVNSRAPYFGVGARRGPQERPCGCGARGPVAVACVGSQYHSAHRITS